MSYLLEFKNVENINFENSEGTCKFLMHRLSSDYLVVNKWVKGSYTFQNKNLRIFWGEESSIANGYYEIRAITFYDNLGEMFHAITNPYDFDAPYFEVIKDVILESNKKEAEKALKDWENEIAIGVPEGKSDIRYKEIHFICSDTLITTPVRVGPAELYPLSKYGNIDLASSIGEMLLNKGIRHSQLDETIKFLNSYGDRRSPMFSMSFYRIYKHQDNIMETLFTYIQTIFGILALNREGYPKVLGGVYIENREDGTLYVEPINLNSYYRGNLIGGIIAGENPFKWNEQFKKIKESEFLREVVNKLNLAHSVLDLDLAYFQYWSILESITYYLFQNKELSKIKEVIELVYGSDRVREEIKLVIGEVSFSFNQLMEMWINRRDLTAHNGGISSAFEGIRRAHGDNLRFISEMKKLNKPLMYGEDNCLLLLKDVCLRVVKKFINEEIIIDEN